MNKLKLLWSYEDHKNGKRQNTKGFAERSERKLALEVKSISNKLTDKENKELSNLVMQAKIDTINLWFTNSAHEITDLYNELKTTFDNRDRDVIISRIGMLQLEIERLREDNMDSD